jgi:uncharacterized protein YuzE
MKIEGHYDREADIGLVRFEGYDPSTAVAEETEAGLRELDPSTGEIVGLEFREASRRLPADFLRCSRRRRSRSRLRFRSAKPQLRLLVTWTDAGRIVS